MDINVKTEGVRAAANEIDKHNVKIKELFGEVERAVRDLDANWDGGVSDQTIGLFYNIKKTYYDNRYNTVNNMVRFLHRQVGDGYESTESTIVSAASAFK